MFRSVSALCGVLALAASSMAGAAEIRGDYVEARTADVYTGPCFSNAEVFITGHQAVMAWKVIQGSWKGVDLSGLTVAAAVQGTTTFAEDKPEAAQAVLIVDQKANAEQREALVAMAKTLAGKRLNHVAAIRTSPMMLTVEEHAMPGDSEAIHVHDTPKAPRASFWAPNLANILTRPLDEGDHACGNEVVAYPPLSAGVSALPAFTLSNEFKGSGLETRWSSPDRRSAFVGHFSY
jgi:hypothetical protein